MLNRQRVVECDRCNCILHVNCFEVMFPTFESRRSSTQAARAVTAATGKRSIRCPLCRQMTSFSKPTAMMNTLAVGNFRAVQVGTRMGSRVVQSEIKDVSYPGGDSVRVYVECHKDIYPDYSSLRVHMLTGGSKDDIHYMLDDRGSSTIAIQQSLTGTNRWIADSTHAPPDAADVADAGGAQQAASSSPTPPLLATTRRDVVRTERYVFNQKRLQSLQWNSSKQSREQGSHHVNRLLYLLPHLDDLAIAANGSVSAAYVLLAELCAKPLRACSSGVYTSQQRQTEIRVQR